MKSESVTNEEKRSKILNYKIPLGSFREDEMPSLFNYTENVLDSRIPYCEVLRKNPGFANPSNVEFLTQELGLSNTTGESSLFPSLQNKSVDFHQNMDCWGLFLYLFSNILFLLGIAIL